MIHDIRRFTQHNAWIINNAPLQIYASAILFSPKLRIVRSLFEENLLSWIITKPFVESHWSPCLQTIEAKPKWHTSVAISNDKKILASHFAAKNLSIWDIASGKQIQTLKTTQGVSQAVFSGDSKNVVAAVAGSIVSWDLDCGTARHQTWSPGYRPSISNDGMFLASRTPDGAIQIQDMVTGTRLSLVNDDYNYEGRKYKQKVKLSNNAKFLAFG